MKKIIYNSFLFLIHFLIYLTCFLNLPKLCAFCIYVLLFKPREFRKKIKKKNNRKVIIVIDRFIGGRRDMEIINKFSKEKFEFLFFRRSIAKIIFTFFSVNRRLFLNYSRPKIFLKKYSGQNNIHRKNHKKFWSEVIFFLKNKYFKNKSINFITFAYYYYTEFALYEACKNNNIPIKLWNKECFTSDHDIKYRIKTNEHKLVFKIFYKISVYNRLIKRMLVGMSKSNKNKIVISGFPRIYDFMVKKRKIKKIKNILFLSFNTIQGIPENISHNTNFNRTYDKTINVLNNLAHKNNINIVIKRKNANLYKSPIPINNKIKLFENGTSEKFIQKADIIIGHNSSSTIESMLNGKYVLVPFFEKNLFMKKFLYNFNDKIIYTSEEKMKKKILSLINKKTIFPKNIKMYEKTLNYYLGDRKNVIKNCIDFLES